MRRVDRQVTWVDHLLTLIAAMCICFVSGNSIGRPGISWFFLPIALVCGVLGFGLGKLAKDRKIESYDWALYCALAAVIIFNIRLLNEVLPDDGFPFQIVMMSFLSWLICVGQLVTWRDTTMAFHAVPCIAAFGLVGAFDYKATPYVFFAFLLCMSSLFFRVHARSMLRRAEASFALSSDREEMGDQQKLWERAFATGAWRWMAGTGWALTSALIIVVLSLLGAPLVQYSVQSVAGRVAFNLPSRPQQRPMLGGNSNPDGSLRLGNGPPSQAGFPLFKFSCEASSYWRTESYDRYTGRSWRNSLANRNATLVPFSQEELKETYPNHREVPFTVKRVRLGLSYNGGTSLPTPGTVVRMDTRKHTFRVTPDLAILQQFGADPKMSGQSLFAPPDMQPGRSVPPPEYRGMLPLTEVGDRTWLNPMLWEATEGASTDYEKAQAIARWIARRCNYNLKVEAPPQDVDVVAYFLTNSKEGYCDLFASSMTLLARKAGLHARMSGGFLADDKPDEYGFVTATDKEAHVWCEVYFENVGWVIFDATEGARDVTPAEGGTKTNRELLDRIVQGTIIAVGIAGLIAIGFALRTDRRKLAERTTQSQLGVHYRSFLAKVEKVTQRPCLLAETPLEYLSRVKHRLGEGRAEAEQLAQMFTRHLFSPAGPPDEVVKEIESRVQTLRRTLRPQDSL
ncbi:MAG: transglutaminase domain-containing protein [Chthonomonas sp.]|nr:transglutaminase domain-containing protein [Chthonomonas sp.]